MLLVVACTTARIASAATMLPTDLDQYMLELINRARANPTAEAARYGIDLNEGLPAGTISATPKQPMAFNLNLIASATGHSQWLLDNDVFQHEGPGGNHPKDRAVNAGYVLNSPWGVGENIAWQGTTLTSPNPIATTAQLHQGLFVDTPIPDRGHRTNMMNDAFREAGVGILSGGFQQYNAVMITTDFAYTAGDPFLTGVIYKDFDHNNFYSPTGEGYLNMDIRAVSTTTGMTYETFSYSTGGYSLRLPADTYNVTIGGGVLKDTTYRGVTIGNLNVKLDVVDSPTLRPWSNLLNPIDVDANGKLEPRDVLLLIDDLNRAGTRSLAAPPTTTLTAYLDTNRDAFFSPADVLTVIDAINRAGSSANLIGSSAGGVMSYVEFSDTFSVPEPTTAAILASALLTLGLLRRRK